MKTREWVPLVVLAVIILVLASMGLRASAVGFWQQSFVPQLLNPGFEEQFTEREAGEIVVAEGWHAWYDQSDSLHRPEYKSEQVGLGRGRVRTGTYGQKFFTTFSPHDGGIYQEVYGVTPGQWYKFSLWAWQWSSNQSNPDVSSGDGKCSVLVGINPWGDANPRNRTTVWGKEALQVYDQWVQVDVVVQAWSNKIVVAARQVCEWPVRHNDVYLDDARLELGGNVEQAPTYTPYPTYTPLPTGTPCPTGGVGPSLDDIRRVIREEIDHTTMQLRREP